MTDEIDKNRNGQWFKCKGCGLPIGFMPARPPEYPTRFVGHAKPSHLLNIPNSVPCDLYRRLDADALWEIHQDAEPLPTPTLCEPVKG